MNFSNLNKFTRGRAFDVYVYLGNEVFNNKYKREASYTLSGATGDDAVFYVGPSHSDPSDGYTLATQTTPQGGKRAQVAEYVKFSGVTGNSFTITAVGTDVAVLENGRRAPIAGIQITTNTTPLLAKIEEPDPVDEREIDTIPEHSALAYLVLILGALLYPRRNRAP